MAYAGTTFESQPMFNETFLIRIGQRELSVKRDFRKRFYPTNPIIECSAGPRPGHVEVLLLRSWLVVFSQARN